MHRHLQFIGLLSLWLGLQGLSIYGSIRVGQSKTKKLYQRFPFWNSAFAFLGWSDGINLWLTLQWTRIGVWWIFRNVGLSLSKKLSRDTRGSRRLEIDEEKGRSQPSSRRWSWMRFEMWILLPITTVALYWALLDSCDWPTFPSSLVLAETGETPEQVFIVANLYNSRAIWDTWSSQVLELVDFLKPENVYVSIYESNSSDGTQDLLKTFGLLLTAKGVRHRIRYGGFEPRVWPHAMSVERIEFLADLRNKALAPLSSPDPSQLPDAEKWKDGRTVFLNDILFDWKDVVRLLNDRTDDGDMYDMICGMDFGADGLYDTWVVRDQCGSWARDEWPYFQDLPSVERIRENRIVDVASCWNGIAVFATELIYRPPARESPVQPIERRETRLEQNPPMMDHPTDLSSFHSPPVKLPLSFRATLIPQGQQSECFLFSYDIHRLYSTKERPPRVAIDPLVRVAYEAHWYELEKEIMNMPRVKWWLRLNRRGMLWRMHLEEWRKQKFVQDSAVWYGFNYPDHCGFQKYAH